MNTGVSRQLRQVDTRASSCTHAHNTKHKLDSNHFVCLSVCLSVRLASRACSATVLCVSCSCQHALKRIFFNELDLPPASLCNNCIQRSSFVCMKLFARRLQSRILTLLRLFGNSAFTLGCKLRFVERHVS